MYITPRHRMEPPAGRASTSRGRAVERPHRRSRRGRGDRHWTRLQRIRHRHRRLRHLHTYVHTMNTHIRRSRRCTPSPDTSAQLSKRRRTRAPATQRYAGGGPRQGWQGRGGSPNRAPRPATPGEISDATRDPALPGPPGPARTCPIRPGNTRPGPGIFQNQDFKLFFDCNISECLQ